MVVILKIMEGKIMLKRCLAFAVLAAMLCAVPASAADIMLGAPKRSGGPDVLTAISNRASAAQKDFEKRELTESELSTILWAATGKNRTKGWTVPLAMGAAPYVDVYALLKKGSYLYDYEHGTLKQAGTRNLLKRAGQQAFTATAPCILVFVSHTPRVENWAYIAAGAMTQNVYLAAQSLGLKTRYIQSCNRETLFDGLDLSPLEKIICIMPVGEQK